METTKTEPARVEFTFHGKCAFKVGDAMSIAGKDYRITDAMPTRILRDEYGSEVNWPGCEVRAVEQ